MADVLGRRIAAALIDIGIMFVLLALVAGIFGNDTAGDASVEDKIRGGPSLLFLALMFAYFCVLEKQSGQTVGKRVMKLRVVGVDGGPPAIGAVLIRNLVRVVDWLPFFYLVGAITVFATGERRVRLGDVAAKTRVVAADAPPTAPPPDGGERPGDEDVLAQILR
jgi:uncharacterized RDD family membrane protein YckC